MHASKLIVVSLLVVLAGCEGLQGAKVRDANSPLLSVRANMRPEGLASGRAEGGFEVGYERYRGKDNQQLNAGESIDVGSGRINGPDTLSNSFKVQEAHLAYTRRYTLGPHFRLEPMMGIARQGYDFKAQSSVSAQRLTSVHWQNKFWYGVTPSWRFNEYWTLELRVTGNVSPRGRAYTFDGGALFSPLPNVALRLGYAERRFSGYPFESLSEIDIRARGPSLALVFDF